MQLGFDFKVCSVDAADNNFEDVSFAMKYYMFSFKVCTAECVYGLVASNKELLDVSASCGAQKLLGPETLDPGGFLVGRRSGLGGTGSLAQKQAVSAKPKEERLYCNY